VSCDIGPLPPNGQIHGSRAENNKANMSREKGRLAKSTKNSSAEVPSEAMELWGNLQHSDNEGITKCSCGCSEKFAYRLNVATGYFRRGRLFICPSCVSGRKSSPQNGALTKMYLELLLGSPWYWLDFIKPKSFVKINHQIRSTSSVFPPCKTLN
jgi:hypothetical protein